MQHGHMGWLPSALVMLAVGSLAILEPGSSPPYEAVLGNVRVQALSASLLRIELKGPRGFEDRPTFTVVDRGFPGVHLRTEMANASGTLLSTAYFKVWLQRNVGVYWKVLSPHGEVIFNPIDNSDVTQSNWKTPLPRRLNRLHWPSPPSAEGYPAGGQAHALVDFPRFFAPEWGVAPIPKGQDVEPALLETNGFDFRNNVDGDTYVFLLGDTLQSWSASRREFLKLTGPVPLLPDYAYGTWFTNWHNYSMDEATAAVRRWNDEGLPLDVWGLDINWRNCSSVDSQLKVSTVEYSDGSDWFYDHPNTILFPNYSDWFAFLRKQGLRTYFNDHPYPVAARGAGGLQTSPEEVEFRWEGLTGWMERGLTFWWFDRNWRFSIPPPNTNSWRTGMDWEGLDNAAWGTYVYYKITEEFHRQNPGHNRPIALTKAMPFDWQPGMDPTGFQEHPTQHRYPVWWTGDGVTLKASIESMVNAGVHDLKPFVHSDCGGDYLGSGGDFLRWTAHCAFGTIIRYHGAGTEKPGPWLYELHAEGPEARALGKHITRTVRKYLLARYKLLPSLIAAGREVTSTGLPYVARCDLFWPDHQLDSSASDQYIFLKDLLVAPIWDTQQNETERSVWIPPGHWEDAWDGRVTLGPCHITVRRVYEQQPMWYRRDGGMLVTASEPGTRVDAQDWSVLTLEAFPSSVARSTTRTVFERRGGERTDIALASDGAGRVHIDIGASGGGAPRAWVLRIHLLPGQHAVGASVDGRPSLSPLRHIEPLKSAGHDFFPLGGAGSAPALHAGAVVELQLASSAKPRSVSVAVSDDVALFA
mmetsp:Transcript_100953/g.301187  ORF Transcript_100953/g.301187 Transcript_100953/m.301187 type:complete len:811 (-) Transcript_100953:162-2594(-)